MSFQFNLIANFYIPPVFFSNNFRLSFLFVLSSNYDSVSNYIFPELIFMLQMFLEYNKNFRTISITDIKFATYFYNSFKVSRRNKDENC